MSENMKLSFKDCPKGEFLFCAVVGQGVKNEDASTRKEDVYEYKVTLQADEKDALPLMDMIDEFIETNAAKDDDIIKLPYQTHDDYDGVPKGKVWIAAKCRTTYIDKDNVEQKANIHIYDATGQKVKLPEGTGVGKGSTGKISGNVGFWERKEGVGCTIWLSGVQIGDFVPYEFEDAPEVMEGTFKGFDKQLTKDESEDEESEPKDSRSLRRERRLSRDGSQRRGRA